MPIDSIDSGVPGSFMMEFERQCGVSLVCVGASIWSWVKLAEQYLTVPGFK